MSIFKIINKISLNNQSLKIQQEYPEKLLNIKKYIMIPNQEYPPPNLLYEDEENQAIFTSIEELGEYLQSNQISMFQLAKQKTNHFAELISHFLYHRKSCQKSSII